MEAFLTFIAVIIFICVLLNNASSKLGVPVLLAFIVLGILFGNSGLVPEIDNFEFAEKICSAALIFIMFYGGFGTNWKAAKGVAVESALLATLGVFVTAGLTGVFCHFVLRWGWIESLLMGSVVSSTDAASVFSILRSRKLGLKNGTAPLLELESGSNDPCSYMLTAVMISLLQGSASAGHVVWMIFAQIVFGAGLGLLIAQAAVFAMRRLQFATKGFDSLFIFGIAVFAYAIPSLVGGNGYLSTYIVGIILGNSHFRGRKDLVSFFDGLTSMMQVLIFFLLGLLARPELMHRVLVPAIAIFFFMVILARPATIALLLTPFRKYGFKQQMLVSFVGLRGAASIVFAIMATVGNEVIQNDILNIVFCIVLLSIALQGTLIPYVAKKLDMLDPDADVMKTFSDFSEEADLQFTKIHIDAGSPWLDKSLRDINLPKSALMCSILHPDGAKSVPFGSTILHEGDEAIICTKAYRSGRHLRIEEKALSKGSKWAGKAIKDYPNKQQSQVLMIRHADGSATIPDGNTILREGDILYINRTD